MAIRLLEELDDLEKMSLIQMSYSRLNTFSMCEAMYFYGYIQKEPSIFGEAAVMGNIVHSVLENRLERNRPVDKAKTGLYVEEFEKQCEVYDPEGVITTKYIDIGITILQDFLDRHHGQSYPIVEKEMNFNVVIGSGLFRGFIDRVDIANGITHITDYKTGAREVTYKGVAQDLQLSIYALAMDKMFPENQVYAELYYLKTGRQKGHLFSRDDLDAAEARVIELVDQVVNKRFFKETTNTRICSFCDHAASGACKAGARRYPR